MSPLPAEEIDRAWLASFSEVSFPALVLDHEGRAVTFNRKGHSWLENHELKVELSALGAPPLPLAPDTLVELDGRGALLGLPGDRTLFALGERPCGEVIDFVHLFRKLLRMEETLKAKNDRLEVYHELLTHDAPNFITAVYGYLQMIQSSDLPREKLLKYVNTSVRQTEALNNLIDTARTLRQLETTPLGPVEAIDLKVAVDSAVEAVLRSNPEKRSEVRDNIPPGHYMVKAEPGLASVFSIILDNAVRYADSPRVAVSLEDTGDAWHLKFADNGRGIPDEKKEFVFLRFDRLDKQRKIRGSGLSLALARALVERHGGRIWVDNAVPGDHTKGSVFHVQLPKA